MLEVDKLPEAESVEENVGVFWLLFFGGRRAGFFFSLFFCGAELMLVVMNSNASTS